MRVTLAVHGGLAAAIGSRRAVRAVEAEALDAQQQRELRRLVESAVAEAPGRAADDRAGRDVMSYTVTVDDAGQVRRLTGSDTTMSPAFAALLDWLEHHTDPR